MHLSNRGTRKTNEANARDASDVNLKNTNPIVKGKKKWSQIKKNLIHGFYVW